MSAAVLYFKNLCRFFFCAHFLCVTGNGAGTLTEGGKWSLARAAGVWDGTEKLKEVPLFMRVKITLACTECKQRNYDTNKNKKNNPDRLEMNKYCRFCRKHTLHRETK